MCVKIAISGLVIVDRHLLGRSVVEATHFQYDEAFRGGIICIAMMELRIEICCMLCLRMQLTDLPSTRSPLIIYLLVNVWLLERK